jgi:hypothetical protein
MLLAYTLLHPITPAPCALFPPPPEHGQWQWWRGGFLDILLKLLAANNGHREQQLNSPLSLSNLFWRPKVSQKNNEKTKELRIWKESPRHSQWINNDDSWLKSLEWANRSFRTIFWGFGYCLWIIIIENAKEN